MFLYNFQVTSMKHFNVVLTLRLSSEGVYLNARTTMEKPSPRLPRIPRCPGTERVARVGVGRESIPGGKTMKKSNGRREWRLATKHTASMCVRVCVFAACNSA